MHGKWDWMQRVTRIFRRTSSTLGRMCLFSFFVQRILFASLTEIAIELGETVIDLGWGYQPLLIDLDFLSPGQCDVVESGQLGQAGKA